MSMLVRVSEILSSSLELDDLFDQVMTVAADELGILRAMLVLRDDAISDEKTDRLRIVAGIGLSDDEIEMGRYEVGEGVTGRVVATGEMHIIEDALSEPNFLNRTGSLQESEPQGKLSFICVPIKEAERVVGAISVTKPFKNNDQLLADARVLKIITSSIAQALRISQMVKLEKEQWLAENQLLKENLRERYRFDNLIGSSPAMLDVLATIGQVSSSRATVLVLGETGTGKELIAKAIHYNSPRRDKPFIRVNCGALSETLLESELFGHVKGSFTGAVRDKIGRFEAADGGSIFLDEIGTLDPQLQVKLLRVLQEREFERVGDHRTVNVDVRVIAATNLDLAEESKKGTFREDLYYRLNVVTLYLPPLRNRREDIPELVEHFLDKFNDENGRGLRKMNRELLNTLTRYPWPGNVRELENAVERAVVMSQSEEFTLDLLPLQIQMFAQQGRQTQARETIEALASRLAEQSIEEYELREGEIYDLTIHEVERQLIGKTLERLGGVKTKSADFLGINRNTLNKKVKDLEIE